MEKAIWTIQPSSRTSRICPPPGARRHKKLSAIGGLAKLQKLSGPAELLQYHIDGFDPQVTAQDGNHEDADIVVRHRDVDPGKQLEDIRPSQDNPCHDPDRKSTRLNSS